MSVLAGLLCLTVGCAEPSIGDIQQAYERAAKLPGAKHVPGLQVVGIDCESRSDTYSCQVGFKVKDDGDDRVYLDAVELKPGNGEGWLLLSGLCLSAR